MAGDKGTHVASPARLAANRRNAQKSTGPRTAAGKRRVALNVQRRDPFAPLRVSSDPGELERQLLARGEDPRDLRRLLRDLIVIFHPEGRLEGVKRN
jgi:hypothetical protein